MKLPNFHLKKTKNISYFCMFNKKMGGKLHFKMKL